LERSLIFKPCTVKSAWIKVGIAAALLFCALCSHAASGGARLLPRPDSVGQLYAVKGLSLQRSSFDAKTEVVVLFYAASWCIACKQISEPLKDLYPELKANYPRLELLTFSRDDSVSARASHLRKSAYPWPAVGPSAAKQRDWQIDLEGGIPQFQAFVLEGEQMRAITPPGTIGSVLGEVDAFFAPDK